MSVRRAVAIGCLGALLASCSGAPGRSPVAPTTAVTGGQQIRWQACDDGLHECGQVSVPVDYATAEAGSLTLPVQRKRATATARLGVLFIDPGGPGAGSLDLGEWFDASGLEGFDIISWNPRGVAAPGVTCLEGPDMDAYVVRNRKPDGKAARADLAAADKSFADACAAHTDPDLLQNLRTEDAARDLDVLRAAVGEEKLNIYGASYSTLLGTRYAQLFPDRVARMVLDSPVTPDRTQAAPQVVGAEQNLHAFAAWCAGRGCGVWGDDEETVVRAIAEWLRGRGDNPVPANGRLLTQSMAVNGVWAGLYGGEAGWPALADALTAARAGDGTTLLSWADTWTGRQPDGSYGPLLAAGYGIGCADGPVTSLAGADDAWATAQSAAPVFGELVGPDYVCAQWPVRASHQTPPAATGVGPVLMVAATGDPATPYSWASSAAEALPSARLLTVERYGHVSYGHDRCVTNAVVSYLVEGRLPGEGETCSG